MNNEEYYESIGMTADGCYIEEKIESDQETIFCPIDPQERMNCDGCQ
jgi:hypothetical protein